MNIGTFIIFLFTFTTFSRAAIVYVDIPDREFNTESLDPFVLVEVESFDLNSDGIDDVDIHFSMETISAVPVVTNRVVGVPDTIAGFGGIAESFVAGQNIGAFLGETEWISREIVDIPFVGETAFGGMLNTCGSATPGIGGGTACGGNFVDVAPGYLGVEFSAENGVNYAWIAISNTAQDNPVVAVVEGWAYETISGQGIAAGAVPEPSIPILFLLGIFVLGQVRRR